MSGENLFLDYSGRGEVEVGDIPSRKGQIVLHRAGSKPPGEAISSREIYDAKIDSSATSTRGQNEGPRAQQFGHIRPVNISISLHGGIALDNDYSKRPRREGTRYYSSRLG